ncbi:hypothetical protein BLNAU_23398 [Blattamonas nauphoetae]|uniref:Uncharacterized protein n=1 Tax=Blattamonas nauphoetae TaxID=2049346 RepID=A0ABQ9WUI5_9EUKA|nr:hypothetical protein BLNAU_23398 [Blattamonas nauphoetae]
MLNHTHQRSPSIFALPHMSHQQTRYHRSRVQEQMAASSAREKIEDNRHKHEKTGTTDESETRIPRPVPQTERKDMKFIEKTPTSEQVFFSQIDSTGALIGEETDCIVEMDFEILLFV